jgi:acetyl esterase
VTLHPQAEALLAKMAAAGAPPIEELDAAANRRNHEASAANLNGEAEPVADVKDLTVPGPGGDVPVRVYTPDAGPGPWPLIVYFHGGGWVVGTLGTYDPLCRALANRSGAIVASVGYRVAPENPFPAPLDDCEAATAALAGMAAELGADPARVGVAGDSAGGGLVAGVTFRSRSAGRPLAFQVLIYPALDPSLTEPSAVENATGYYLTTAGMRWYWEQYLAGGADPGDPEVSPLRQPDLTGLPPALVITAGYDPLRDEGEAYVERLRASGVEAELARFDGMIHGFLRFRAVLDAAEEATAKIAEFVRRVTG